MLGHTEHLGLLAELDCVGFLGVAPRGVTATLNLGISFGEEGVALAVINNHFSGDPRIFILDCLILLGVDHHNGQTRQSLITNIELDGYGSSFAIHRNAIHNGLREIDSSLATDLSLRLSHHKAAIGCSEGRDQRCAIDKIGHLATEHAIAINREVQVLGEGWVLRLLQRERAEGRNLGFGRRRRSRVGILATSHKKDGANTN